MDASIENFPQEVEPPTKFVIPFGLSKDTANLISGYLTNRDLANLCVSSKGLQSIFHSSLEKRLMSYFLNYIVEGRLDKVEEILNKHQKLVFLQGDITDLSGRTFKRITAFQYATWALDKEMWELILKYLPEADAYNQLMVFERKRPHVTQVHGVRLNFQPLLDAYQKYIDNSDKWNREQREAWWCKEVGGTQHQMPAWFVYTFCEIGEDKAWPINDFKKNFTRDPEHLIWWYEKKYNGGKLGFKWGSYRALDRACTSSGLWGGLWKCGTADRARTSQFMEGRTNELSQLVERLSQIYDREKNSAPKSDNF